MAKLSTNHAALIDFYRNQKGTPSLKRLKIHFSYEEKCYIIDRISQPLQQLVYQSSFPKSLEELGEGNFMGGAEKFIDEINWTLLAIRKDYKKLAEFVTLKDEFETNYLKGYYKDASTTLDYIETNLGQSIWLIEARLLLKDTYKGLAENKLYLNEVTEKKGAHYITRIADFLSKKVEKELSPHRFAGEFRNFVGRVKDAFGDSTSEYYFFKTNIYGLLSYKHKTMMMAFDQRASLIDRYLTMLTCLRQHISTNAISQIEKKELSSRVYYLFKKLKDPILIKLQAALIGIFPDQLTNEEQWAYNIINYYTIGDYEKVILESKSYLKTYLQNFEIYLIYCKALLNSRSAFQPVPGNDNTVNEILKNVYELVKNDEDPEMCIRALTKLSMQLSSFDIGDQLTHFLLKETSGNDQFHKQSLLSSRFFLPSFGRFFDNRADSLSYYNFYSHKISTKSLTVDFFKCITEKDLSQLNHFSLPEYRLLFYQALFNENNGDFSKAILIWNDLKNKYSDISHLFKASVEHLFHCYLKEKKYNEALSLYVNTFFSNPYCTAKMDTVPLESDLRKSKMGIVEHNIDLPLFFYFASSKQTTLSNGVELYFNRCNVKTPSQYVDSLTNKNLVEEDLNKVFFFLNYVCTTSLFTHIVKIKGTKTKLTERLNVCVFLLNNEPYNSESYVNEIDDIEREILIQEGLREYDESKIFINDKMIKKNLLKDMEADYQRYRKYSLLLKHYPKVKVLITTALFDVEGEKQKLDKAIFSTDPLFDQFKQMFFELREKFLFSQYGLMEFLSGRIRHGVFKSEIRPKFEKLELITERDAHTGVYRQSDFWKAKLSYLEGGVLNQIYTYQADFSKNIDDLIEEDALKKYLLIKLEDKNPDGWFDYQFTDIDLAVIYSSFNNRFNFDEFVDKCFEFLYLRTDEILVDIRKKITGEYSQRFEAVIANFEANLRAIASEYQIHELLTKINNIKVFVQNDLNKIAMWFNRSGSVTKDFSIGKIIEISLQHTNRGFEKKEIELIRNLSCARTFKGEFYPYFIDLIRVFFVNILQHNEAVDGKILATLTVTEKWPILKISVSNDLSQTGVKMSTVPYSKVDEGRSQTEGKSGFPKVKRILKSYLGEKNSENKLDFPSDDNSKFVVECYINIEELVVK